MWSLRVLTASLITLSWHRPSMDYLSLRSPPASNGSRIFFSLASFIELFVSEPSQSCPCEFLIVTLPTDTRLLHPHSSPSPLTGSAPHGHILFSRQHPKRRLNFAHIQPPTAQLRHIHEHQHERFLHRADLLTLAHHPRTARPPRQPLTLHRAAADPAPHLACSRPRLWASFAAAAPGDLRPL